MCAPAKVVYVLEVRTQPRGNRTARDQWQLRGVYLTFPEACASGDKLGRLDRWRAYGVPALGSLANMVPVEAA